MQIDATELEELASFFARRFDLHLRPLGPEVGPLGQRVDAWRAQLEAAQEAGTLSALLVRASRRYPDDVNLAEVVRLVAEPSAGADRLAGLLLFGTGLAAAFLGTVFLGAAGVGYALVGLESVTPPEAVVVVALDDGHPLVPQRRERAAVGGRCSAPDGGVVGYWYAGVTPPEGNTVVMERMVNVRTAYPHRDNGWNARASIACVLRPGDRLELSQEPVHVDGDRYWVPLVSGDLRLPDA